MTKERLRIEQVDDYACSVYWDNDSVGVVVWSPKSWWFSNEGKEILRGELVMGWQDVVKVKIEEYFINLELTHHKYIALTGDTSWLSLLITWCYATGEDEARQILKSRIQYDTYGRERMAIWDNWQQHGYQVRLK